jgi:sterol 24-C-methyltransferase
MSIWEVNNTDNVHEGQKSRIRDVDQAVSTSIRRNIERRLTEYSYYNLATDLYENGWGQSFHFCRFAYGEPFNQAIARHEHYLAHSIGIKQGMKVLDVGCGVGGPAREIAKFTGAHITGLNNNDYQIERATAYAQKEGLSNQLKFVKGDFMVCTSQSPQKDPY